MKSLIGTCPGVGVGGGGATGAGAGAGAGGCGVGAWGESLSGIEFSSFGHDATGRVSDAISQNAF
jgi:hypothetical protein